MKNITGKALPISILLITISSVNSWTLYPIGNTTIWWVLYSLILILFLLAKKALGSLLTENIWPIKFFLLIVLSSFVHGCIVAEYYWDWKLLIGNLMVFMMPLAAYVFCSPPLLTQTLRTWIRYALIFFLLFLTVLLPEAYGRYLVPISILLLFFPRLPLMWKILGLISILFIMVSSSDSRSNVIKFVMPFGIGLLYYLGNLWNNRLRKKIYFSVALLFILSPFTLFILASTNTFNIFDMTNYMAKYEDYAKREGDEGEYSLLDDTRTFIYVEQINSAITNNYWLLGRSMARGYDTEAFAGEYQDFQSDTNRKERQSSEVSILNVFNYFGILGVLSYFLIFVMASYNAILRSNNIYMNLVGVYVSFRWSYAWVEDFNLFDLNNLFLWITIGMCFSKAFINMSNEQFIFWIKNIFNKNMSSTTKVNLNPRRI